MYMRLQPICPAAPVMTTRIGSAMIEFLETIKKKNFFDYVLLRTRDKYCYYWSIAQIVIDRGHGENTLVNNPKKVKLKSRF